MVHRDKSPGHAPKYSLPMPLTAIPPGAITLRYHNKKKQIQMVFCSP